MNQNTEAKNIIRHNQNNSNIETRFANRMQSIFSVTGQIVNDFYLEIGIYCIGLLNAALVAWSIYTDLLSDNQPLLYAIALGVIALVAVEGLAVYLVGAAAKTNNGWLWFFSVVFAGFFTFAHYQVAYGDMHISDYITYAIPFFVVIGYWARTLKVEIEDNQIDKAQLKKDELERQRQIEDEKRLFEMEEKRAKRAEKHAQKMAQLEAQKEVSLKGQSLSDRNSARVTPSIDTINDTKKINADTRRKKVLDLLNDDMSYANIASELGVSLSTVKRDVKTLNGSVQKKEL